MKRDIDHDLKMHLHRLGDQPDATVEVCCENPGCLDWWEAPHDDPDGLWDRHGVRGATRPGDPFVSDTCPNCICSACGGATRLFTATASCGPRSEEIEMGRGCGDCGWVNA